VPCSLVQVDRRFRGAYCLHYHPHYHEDVNADSTSVYFNETDGSLSQKAVIIHAAVRTRNFAGTRLNSMGDVWKRQGRIVCRELSKSCVNSEGQNNEANMKGNSWFCAMNGRINRRRGPL
jgi:hypothetical protein